MNSVQFSSPLAAWRKAPQLRPGMAVATISPSGPLPQERFEQGLARLGERYQVVQSAGVLDRQGFLAGPDGRRLSELRWALGDPGVHAVIAGRGGHGLMRLVAALDTVPRHELRAVPIVGFSDITVLHAFAASRQLISIHGPVVTQLAILPDEDVASLWQLLEDPAPPPPLEQLTPVCGSGAPVEGRLIGGNLEVLSRLCGTPLQRALTPGEPVVLLLEEVGEAPYRIDRALAQLQQAGALAEVRAIVVGELLRCAGPPESPPALDVLADWATQLGVPMVCGAPVGHGERNRALPHGGRVTLEPAARRLVFHDGALSPDTEPKAGLD